MEKRSRDRNEDQPSNSPPSPRIRKPLSMPSRRIPLERRVTLDFPHTQGIVTETLSNVSMTGMFVRSQRPEPPGTRVTFELDLVGGGQSIRGQAEVVWGRAQDEGTGRPPGMGLRFIELDKGNQKWIRQAVEDQLRRGVASFRLDASNSESPAPHVAIPHQPAISSPGDSLESVHWGREDDTDFSQRHPYAGAAVARSAAEPPRRWGIYAAIAAAIAGILTLGFFLGRGTAISPVGAESPPPEESTATELTAVTAQTAVPGQAEALASEDIDSIEREVLETVVSWAQAWSDQQPEAYLAFYSQDFRPPGGRNREQWEVQRKARISAPSRIAVGITEVATERLAPGHWRVTFLQDYSSDSFRDSTRKIMELALEAGTWRILAEGAAP